MIEVTIELTNELTNELTIELTNESTIELTNELTIELTNESAAIYNDLQRTGVGWCPIFTKEGYIRA